MQEFTAPLNTTYKIQCWGASGGNCYENHTYGDFLNTVYGGKGGYCAGKITLPYNISLYVYIGQSGEGVRVKTFNGGGETGGAYDAKSGGGATDIRLSNGNWKDFSSLKSRIIVAAGGGGAQHFLSGCDGGYAGGLSGQDGFKSGTGVNYTIATGASQTLGGHRGYDPEYNGFNGTFGIGGDAEPEQKASHGSGGGSGYYGGGGGSHATNVVGSGGGGSSFISGYLGCDAIAESSTEDNIIHTGQPNHYSGYMFVHSVMIDGGSVMPSPSGGTETGHSGNGYCIITWQQLP